MQEQLYTAASVLMSTRSAEGGEYAELSELTDSGPSSPHWPVTLRLRGPDSAMYGTHHRESSRRYPKPMTMPIMSLTSITEGCTQTSPYQFAAARREVRETGRVAENRARGGIPVVILPQEDCPGSEPDISSRVTYDS